MFKIEQDKFSEHNSISITNPCYPSYATRDVYRHVGYDWLLLVEDDLARIIVEDVLFGCRIVNSKLIHITPVGGWENVLKLQLDLLKNNVLGEGKKIISILDGDIESECNRNSTYNSLPKLFLPIASVEKYLKRILVDKKDNVIFKIINDEFFQLESLSSVIQNYQHTIGRNNDYNGKKLYKTFILKAVNKRSIDEQQFVRRLAKIIKESIDFSRFNDSITKLLQ